MLFENPEVCLHVRGQREWETAGGCNQRFTSCLGGEDLTKILGDIYPETSVCKCGKGCRLDESTLIEQGCMSCVCMFVFVRV